jgi:tetratricopeptide (TPR) repeat protein
MRGNPNVIVLVLFIVHALPISYSTDTYPSMDLYVLSDGTVEVNYFSPVNSSAISIFLTLPGTGYQNLLITNLEGVPLEYEYNSTGILVETLGSSSLDILYYTQSITSKTEDIWELNLTAPIPCKIVLPEGSMIIGLNQIPLEIGSNIDNPYVIMDAGKFVISYLKGVIDQRSLAEEAIQEAHSHLQYYRNQDIVINEAEILLNQSETALNQNEYDKAIELAQEAIEEADKVEELASQASESIDQATLSIQNAKLEHRTKGLEEAEDILQEALSSYEYGEYVVSKTQALQSKIIAENASKTQTNFLFYLGGIASLLFTGAIIYYYGGNRHKEHEITSIIADLDIIFYDNPRLRMDDKEVVRYIAENRGELFANEIRERFDIPRTSLWRMIRRLKEKEILEERKVGGQSLVSIHRRYRK